MACCLAGAPALVAANQLVLITEGEGGTLAAAQMKHWALAGGATVDVKTSDPAGEAAAIKAAADATVLVFREVAKPDAVTTVAASTSAKSSADAIVKALADDAAQAEKSVQPTTMPALAAATPADAALAGDAKVIVVSVPTSKSTPVSTRARAFRIAAAQVLSASGAYTGSVDNVLPARTAGTLQVAVYDGKGSNNSPGPEAMWKILSTTDHVAFTFVGPQEMNADALKQFDLVMFPGGSGGGQGNALGETNREAIRSFVKDGGAYIGNCAGGYLASSSYPWSLHLINVDTTNAENGNWARGTGDVKVELTDDGRKMLGDHSVVTLHYANGPIYVLGDHAELPQVKVLAYYRTEIAKKDVNKGKMVNTPAIVCAPFGKGKVVAFSCHPEYSTDYTDFIRSAVKWVTAKDTKTE